MLQVCGMQGEKLVSALSMYMEDHKQAVGVGAMDAPQKRAAMQEGAKAWKQLDATARKPWVDRAANCSIILPEVLALHYAGYLVDHSVDCAGNGANRLWSCVGSVVVYGGP